MNALYVWRNRTVLGKLGETDYGLSGGRAVFTFLILMGFEGEA